MGKLISSKHLESISDLTLMAPIKQGFIDAFEAVTYETRLRKILEALFNIRSTAREHSKLKPFADPTERIQSLLDFRLVMLDIEPRQLLLSATFDRPLEPYMRLIWHPLGPLLDVVFCNCDGYVTATEHGFDDYLAWVRKSQIDTDFFYTANGLTIDDVNYLMKVEKLQRLAGVPQPQADALKLGSVTSASPLFVPPDGPTAEAAKVRCEQKAESNQLGIEALVALHKLTDFYPPDRPDGKYLRWAAKQLLEGWCRADLGASALVVEEQLEWLEGDGPPPKKMACGERMELDTDNVQGGILNSYSCEDKPARGKLLLFRIASAGRARGFLKRLASPASAGDTLRIRTETVEGEAPSGDVALNLAFTRHGLANIGLPDAELERFPQEFREGMEDRAGLLGDIQDNHPRRWELPPRYRPKGKRGEFPDVPVDLAEVDIVIQLRTNLPRQEQDDPVDAALRALKDEHATGLELLSIEDMQSAPKVTGIKAPEHFGFADGISQPRIAASAGACDAGATPLGDVLLGYCNSRTDRPPPANPILDDGTFLVVRKLNQDVACLNEFLDRTAAALAKEEPTITRDMLVGKLLGRYPDGRPASDPARAAGFNKFTYDDRNGGSFDDAAGTGCPFHAHVRRTHPRSGPVHGRRGPRIVRRGLSYGPPYDQQTKDAERGVFFMAYNASIAEQFEVIQRWMVGGNSTGIGSWQNDPLIGPAPNGEPRIYEFFHNGRKLTFAVDREFVRLRWGAYLFVPSISGIKAIVAAAVDPQTAGRTREAVQAERGKAIIDRLLALAKKEPGGRAAAAAEWKACLEDFGAKDPAEKDQAMAVWAAIRRYHNGAIRVPYGMTGETPRDVVLVGSKELVMRVFRDPGDSFSMQGQMGRMRESFGEIYLGMDRGPQYEAKSRTNQYLFEIGEAQAFEVARTAAIQCVVRTFAVASALGIGETKMDLRRHLITPSLAIICNRWFGIPDALPPGQAPDQTNFVDPWGWSWEPAEARKPRCPGDYMATSRFCFYPDPIPQVRDYGRSQGQALRKVVRAYFDTLRDPGKPGQPAGGILAEPSDGLAPVGFLSAIMANMKGDDGEPVYRDNDELARNVIGVMTGFLPPADGCMRWALYEWIEEKLLPRVQHDLLADGSPTPYERADKALRPWLERAMQKRPAPDLLWRTATKEHRLGDVTVGVDDKIIVGIVSALAEDAAAGVTDVYPVFGGDRSAADAPLHACPAYKAAMGTMLGILSGLLESVRIEPLPSPLLIKLSAPSDALEPQIEAARKDIAAGLAASQAGEAGPASPSDVPEDQTQAGECGGISQAGSADQPAGDPVN